MLNNSLELHLAANPRGQGAAYEELTVVSPTRSPDFEDISNLPYVRAWVKDNDVPGSRLGPGHSVLILGGCGVKRGEHNPERNTAASQHSIPALSPGNASSTTGVHARALSQTQSVQYSSESPAVGESKRDHFTFSLAAGGHFPARSARGSKHTRYHAGRHPVSTQDPPDEAQRWARVSHRHKLGGIPQPGTHSTEAAWDPDSCHGVSSSP
ncbi:hypothetical protein DV738_g712, partial [Chaetothyriales sp. CBS 135597]